MRRFVRTGLLAMGLLAASAWPAVAVPTDVIGEPGCLHIQNGPFGTPPYEDQCGAGGNGVSFVSTTPETVVVTFSALYMNGKFVEVVESRNPVEFDVFFTVTTPLFLFDPSFFSDPALSIRGADGELLPIVLTDNNTLFFDRRVNMTANLPVGTIIRGFDLSFRCTDNDPTSDPSCVDTFGLQNFVVTSGYNNCPDFPTSGQCDEPVVGLVVGTLAAVPEPSTLVLLGAGLVAVAAWRRRIRLE